MRPKIEELHDASKYNLIHSFHVDDTMKFLMGQLDDTDKKSNKWLKVFFFSFFAGLIGYFGFKLGASFAMKGTATKAADGLQMGYAVLAMFLVVLPVHELIHGLTFKYFKAPKVGYGASLKAGMVYAYAQKFPISMPELRVLAMMPFFVLTALFFILWMLLPQYQLFFIVLLLIHSLACVGDFALARYSLRNKNRTIFTYDDLEEKKTYYFEKKLI